MAYRSSFHAELVPVSVDTVRVTVVTCGLDHSTDISDLISNDARKKNVNKNVKWYY